MEEESGMVGVRGWETRRAGGDEAKLTSES